MVKKLAYLAIKKRPKLINWWIIFAAHSSQAGTVSSILVAAGTIPEPDGVIRGCGRTLVAHSCLVLMAPSESLTTRLG
jgi:hypothetical protein